MRDSKQPHNDLVRSGRPGHNHNALAGARWRLLLTIHSNGNILEVMPIGSSPTRRSVNVLIRSKQLRTTDIFVRAKHLLPGGRRRSWRTPPAIWCDCLPRIWAVGWRPRPWRTAPSGRCPRPPRTTPDQAASSSRGKQIRPNHSLLVPAKQL